MNNDIVEMIAVAVAAAMADMRQEKETWGAKEIGFHIDKSPERVLARYACKPDFPKAIRLEDKDGARGHPRWFPEDIRKWWRKNQSVN